MHPIFVTLAGLWLGMARHLWQTTLVLAVLFALARALRKAPAGVLYLLWSLAFVKLLLPASVLGGWTQAMLLRIHPELASARVTVGALTVLGSVVDPLGRIGTIAGFLLRPGSWLLPALTLLWVAGFAGTLARLVRTGRSARRVRLVRDEEVSPAVREKLDESLRAVPVPRGAVSLVFDRMAPCVAGLLRPRILLAVALVEALPPAELQAVLLHEEAHRRRREPLRSALIAVGSSIYFFYPLIGFLRRRLVQSVELVCDEKVMDHGIRPEVYARALARTVRLDLSAPTLLHSLAAEKGSFLMNRMHRIRSGGAGPLRPRQICALALALLLVVLGSLFPEGLLNGCARESKVATQESPTPPAKSEVARPAAQTAVASGQTTAISSQTAATSEQIAAPGDSAGAVQDCDQAPVLVNMPPPKYPTEAREKGIEGTVQVRALVGIEGKVTQASLARSVDPQLAQAGIEAVKGATFKPGLKAGKPVAVWVQIPIKFALH